jgi:hypothetical protein
MSAVVRARSLTKVDVKLGKSTAVTAAGTIQSLVAISFGGA